MPLSQSEVESRLTKEEQDALKKYNDAKLPPLSPKTSADLLQLFLQGYGCVEISKMNPGFGLGIIVKARAEHGWDQQREEYTEALMSQTRESLQRAQLEAKRFAADGIAVYHKLVGDKFRKFLQTGDEKVLGDDMKMSLKTYKEFLTILETLNKVKTPEISGTIGHKIEKTEEEKVAVVEPPSNFSDMLKLLGNVS